jgi:hypothetical protein
MKIYVAARFERYQEMQGVRDVLRGMGHEVTSRWIDLHGGKESVDGLEDQLQTNPEEFEEYGEHDLEDIRNADVIMCFAGGGGRGGRHVEWGYAYALGKRMILVGPRENVFHALGCVEHYASWPSLVMALADERGWPKAQAFDGPTGRVMIIDD